MTLTEHIIKLLEKNTLSSREVADVLGWESGSVNSIITNNVRRGRIRVVQKEVTPWTYRAVKEEAEATPLVEQVVELLKTNRMTVQEVTKRLDADSTTQIGGMISERVSKGQLKVVGRKRNKSTGCYVNVYTYDETYIEPEKPVIVIRKREEDKELSKLFRVFKPEKGSINVMGMWI